MQTCNAGTDALEKKPPICHVFNVLFGFFLVFFLVFFFLF